MVWERTSPSRAPRWVTQSNCLIDGGCARSLAWCVWWTNPSLLRRMTYAFYRVGPRAAGRGGHRVSRGPARAIVANAHRPLESCVGAAEPKWAILPDARFQRGRALRTHGRFPGRLRSATGRFRRKRLARVRDLRPQQRHNPLHAGFGQELGLPDRYVLPRRTEGPVHRRTADRSQCGTHGYPADASVYGRPRGWVRGGDGCLLPRSLV